MFIAVMAMLLLVPLVNLAVVSSAGAVTFGPWVEEECRSCHTIMAPNRHIPTLHHLKAEQTGKDCTYCHKVNPDVPSGINIIRNCPTCHTPGGIAPVPHPDPPVLHNMVGPPDPADAVMVCQDCHNPNVVIEHVVVKGRACPVCHSKDDDTIQGTINLGKGGTKVFCTNCHGSITNLKQIHAAKHDHVTVPYEDCKTCHNPNVLFEHVDNRGKVCRDCHQHQNPAVFNTITSGMRGIGVYCPDCHNFIRPSSYGTGGFFGNHYRQHESTTVPGGECLECHDPNAVKEHEARQVGCLACHRSSDPTVEAGIRKGMDNQPTACGECHKSVHGVLNKYPVANAGADVTVELGTAVTLNGGASNDPDGTIASYRWDLADGNTSNSISVTHTYASAGVYTVKLTVTDNNGASHQDRVVVTVMDITNLPPTANAGADMTGNPNQPLTFNGSGSSDPDGFIKSYVWNFGDGQGGSGSTVSHTYTVLGTYNVKLTVTDDGGRSAEDTVVVNIVATPNDAPIAVAGDDKTAAVGSMVSFSGAGSHDPDGSIVEYSWDFGDGFTFSDGSGETSHAYTSAGSYTATLTVKDNLGATASDTVVITVAAAANKLPVANAGADQTVNVGQVVNFSGAGSSDPDGTIESYVWQFGDGETMAGSSSTASHSYGAAGSYTVTLTVTDNRGGKATDTAIVTVRSAGTTQAAKQVMWVRDLASPTAADSTGSKVNITRHFADGNVTVAAPVDKQSGNNKIMAMGSLVEAGSLGNLKLRLYAASLYQGAAQTIRIYPYQSDMDSVNTALYVDATISAAGWVEIDVKPLLASMNGFGWIKFRISNTTSRVELSEGLFVIQ